MKYIVAVSGGVDSVVLLDMFAKQYDASNLVVAHFEHGIRGEDSENDALFVEKLSQKYRVKYEISYGKLTKNSSEAEARKARYDFLHSVADKYGGAIVTAHHQDDLVETIALNIARGTGWRGLAVFGNTQIQRPLLHLTKKDIYSYALAHDLEWVEDETNQMNMYTRNKLRRVIWRLSQDDRKRLLQLYEDQIAIRAEIEAELGHFIGTLNSRYFMIMIPDNIALELLRLATATLLTRPQLRQLLLSIKTVQSGAQSQAGNGVVAKFTRREFFIEYH